MSRKGPILKCDYTETCWRSPRFSVGDMDYCPRHFAQTGLPYPKEETLEEANARMRLVSDVLSGRKR